MDEMDLITAKLDGIKNQIDATAELLSSRIRYGDRQVEALVTVATDRHDRLQKDFDTLRADFATFKGHVESGELAAAQQKIAWSRQTVFAIIGWVVAVAAIVGAFVR